MSKKRILSICCLGLIALALVMATIETKAKENATVGTMAIDPPIGKW